MLHDTIQWQVVTQVIRPDRRREGAICVNKKQQISLSLLLTASIIMPAGCSVSLVARVTAAHQFGIASSVSGRLQEHDKDFPSSLVIFGQDHLLFFYFFIFNFMNGFNKKPPGFMSTVYRWDMHWKLFFIYFKLQIPPGTFSNIYAHEICFCDQWIKKKLPLMMSMEGLLFIRCALCWHTRILDPGKSTYCQFTIL